MTRRQTLKRLKTTSLLNVYHGKNRGVLPLAGSHRESDCDWRNIVTWLNPIGVQLSRTWVFSVWVLQKRYNSTLQYL